MMNISKKLVVSSISSILVFSFPVAAFANGFTGGFIQNVASSNPIGVSSSITPDNPYVVDGSAAWVLLGNNSGAYSFAQDGWAKTGSMSAPEVFTQWEGPSYTDNPPQYYPQYSASQTHSYIVSDSNRTGPYGGYIGFGMDGTLLGQVYWNNVFPSGYTPNELGYSTEIDPRFPLRFIPTNATLHNM